MDKQLLDIQPRELKFLFELKKQSTCSIRLVNTSHQHVAFKVKTTSPKKYCVRPNAGIIPPKCSSDFTVTMQAQRVAPPDMICKDKFLIQGTIVPSGTTEEYITSSMFSKDEGRYVEENKLRVSLISPPHSPDLSPINGTLKQGPNEALLHKVQGLNGVGFLTTEPMVAKDFDLLKIVDDGDLHLENGVKSEEKSSLAEEIVMKAAKDAKSVEQKGLSEEILMKAAEDVKSAEQTRLAEEIVMKAAKDVKLEEEKCSTEEIMMKSAKNVQLAGRSISTQEVVMNSAKNVKLEEKNNLEEEIVMKSANNVDPHMKTSAVELNLVKDIEQIKSQLNDLEYKLSEAQSTVAKLTEDRRLSAQERLLLKEELAMLKSRKTIKRVQAEFPLLFVVMVAMISAMLGYLVRS